jgi:hypothetical protein
MVDSDLGMEVVGSDNRAFYSSSGFVSGYLILPYRVMSWSSMRNGKEK